MMEQFLVYNDGLKEVGARLEDVCAHDCFRLVVADLDELRTGHDQLFDVKLEFNEELFNKTRVGPFLEHLGPKVHYGCFCDLDDNGWEMRLCFLLTENSFVLIGWGELTREQIAIWAQRGMLTDPIDLAQILGLTVLQHHQARLEQIEEEMDHLEVEILKGPRAWQQARIIGLHRKVLSLKKSLNLHQSVFNRLADFQPSAGPALWRDLVSDTQRELDNVRQTHELVENLREAYQAAVDNRSNDIMKLLTLMATILLPINLLTSFFGMNFHNMPLLDKPYGLPVFYTVSVLIAAMAFWYFWRQKWLK